MALQLMAPQLMVPQAMALSVATVVEVTGPEAMEITITAMEPEAMGITIIAMEPEAMEITITAMEITITAMGPGVMEQEAMVQEAMGPEAMEIITAMAVEVDITEIILMVMESKAPMI